MDRKKLYATILLCCFYLAASIGYAENTVDATVQKWSVMGQDFELRISSEIPTETVADLPMISVAFHPFNATEISKTLAPTLNGMENSAFQEIVYGNGDSRTEYMRITNSDGTLFYCSEYGDRFNEIRNLDDNKQDRSVYFTNERELEGFPLGEALSLVQSMVNLMDIDVDFTSMRHYTIDKSTFDRVMNAMKNSELAQDVRNADYSPMDRGGE